MFVPAESTSMFCSSVLTFGPSEPEVPGLVPEIRTSTRMPGTTNPATPTASKRIVDSLRFKKSCSPYGRSAEICPKLAAYEDLFLKKKRAGRSSTDHQGRDCLIWNVHCVYCPTYKAIAQHLHLRFAT